MPIRKSKFLITVWPIPGHLYPTIAIAHALKKRNHDVAFYTGSMASTVIEQEGFLCFPFKQVDEERWYQLLFSNKYRSTSRWKKAFLFRTMLRKWLVETIPQQMADLEEVLMNWQPEVLVCDPTLWAPILILHDVQHIPVAVTSLAAGCYLPGSDAPPFGLGLPSPRNWHTKVITQLAYIANDLYARDFRRAANAMRERYGLPLLKCSVNEFAGQMPAYLVPSTPELDYMRQDLPASVHYVGPYLWNRPITQPPPIWLEELSKDQPWVHVTEGTVHVGKPVLLQAAAQGLANLSMQVIMTTGGNRNSEELDIGPIAPNVRLENWISHSDLLSHLDVLVTTGGAGTVLAALNAGVPMVVIPTEWDKPENAQRVVEAGAGLRLSQYRCTPRRLRAAVEHVLNEPSFRQNAQRIADSFKRFGGAEQAAEVLQSLASN